MHSTKVFGGVVFPNEPKPQMTRIVTSTYRYKRPPRKRKPVTLELPEIVRTKITPHPRARRAPVVFCFGLELDTPCSNRADGRDQ
jgi:hypothetical protein